MHKIIVPGVNELDISTFCENYILIRGAEPVLKTGELYPHSVLISRNNVAFHGIPRDIFLSEGDVVTVDVVLMKNGWCGDGAWTYEVGRCSENLKKLVQFSKELIYKCVESLNKVRDLSVIGSVVCEQCSIHGYRVIDEGAGHGIGRDIHEEPQIIFKPESLSIPLKKGMVFTIEPVIANSVNPLKYNSSGEAYLSEKDLAVQFEHMVAVNERGIEILTERDSLFK